MRALVALVVLYGSVSLVNAAEKLKTPDANDFLAACRGFAKYAREIQDPANYSAALVSSRAIEQSIMDRGRPHMSVAVLRQCADIIRPIVAVHVDRSYRSDSGQYGRAIATYRNMNKRTLSLALVRCDAIDIISKAGTQEVPVAGPIPPDVERTLEFMIPLAGGDMDHVECTVTLER